jgi:Ser/Thr protein kinase RdoA (MazF antagonist)
MQPWEDPGASALLGRFSVARDGLLGSGGEAWVLALDGERVLRVPKPGARRRESLARCELLSELQRSAHRVPFAVPQVIEQHAFDDRIATVEARLPGQTLTSALTSSSGERRRALVYAYLDAAARIGDLEVERPYFGELAREKPLRTDTCSAYLEAAAVRSLRVAGPDFAAQRPAAVVAALTPSERPCLVHLDAFPGNMLAEDGQISAVLDFGVLSILGDRRLDPLCAAAYLAPEITLGASSDDWQAAQHWLDEHDLLDAFEPAHRWLAIFWSGAVDDPRLQAWSRRVLGIPSAA